MRAETNAVGARVRARRHALGLTLRNLASRSGLSERYLILTEQGAANLSLEKLCLLARALEVSPTWLFSDGARGDVDTLLCARNEAELNEIAAWLRRRFAPTSRPVVALLGVRGAGKSAVGRALADRMRRPFVELDARIEAAAALSLAEIFSLHGEAYYRRLEHEVLGVLLAEPSPLVLATGGSIVTHPENFERLRRAAVTVWLRARPEDHWDRVILQGDRRPMHDHPEALAELKDLCARREPLYRQADVVIETSGLAVGAVTDRVLAALEPAPDDG